MRRTLILIAAVIALFGAGLWLLRQTPASDTDTKAPVVLAAASLQEAMEAAADAWAAKGHPRPVLSFAASSALARQVETDAPADLFISADEEWMDQLAARNKIDKATRATLLGNRLVLIAPASSKLTLQITPGFPLARALGGGRLALADPSGVPAGSYAKQALETMGVWQEVSNRIAAGDNVRAALSLVARGEAPLGIVYATDARVESKVRVVATFPESSHAAILYPIAQLSASRSKDAAGLRAFLLSPEGRAVFTRFGFTVPRT